MAAAHEAVSALARGKRGPGLGTMVGDEPGDIVLVILREEFGDVDEKVAERIIRALNALKMRAYRNKKKVGGG